MIACMMKPSRKKPTMIPARGTPYKDIEPNQATTSSPMVIINANQSAKKSPPNDEIADTNKDNAGSKRENRSGDVTEADGYINKGFRNKRNQINEAVNQIQDYATDSGEEIRNRSKERCQLSSPSFFLTPEPREREALRETRPTTTRHIESVRGNV